MFDRVLLILLVLLLPIGIIVSRIMTGDIKIGNNSSLDSQKIDALIAQVSKQTALTKKGSSGFSITGVVYSSESASLEVGGMAPDPQKYIWVWLAGYQNIPIVKKGASPSPQSNQLGWTGPQIVTPIGSSFTATVDVKNFYGIVEIRVEQGSSADSVRFDLDKKKQV